VKPVCMVIGLSTGVRHVSFGHFGYRGETCELFGSGYRGETCELVALGYSWVTKV
jgi:hypothetical protein